MILKKVKDKLFKKVWVRADHPVLKRVDKHVNIIDANRIMAELKISGYENIRTEEHDFIEEIV